MRRVLAVFALFAALIWIVSQNSARVEAQEQASVPRSASASKSTAPATPVVIVSGAQYANVRGLAADASGALYISLSATPPAKNCVTSTASSSASDSATAAKLAVTVFSNCSLAPSEDPSGIAAAPSNKVYLANRSQNTIRLLNMATGSVAAVPMVPAAGTATAASSNSDPFEPAGLASDAQGNLYIADRGNNRVLGFAPNAQHFAYIAHVLDAAAVAVYAANDQLYVASPASNRVFAVGLDKNDVQVFAGTGAFTASSAAANAQSNPTPANVQLGAPEGVAADGEGNVFISDTGANVLVRVDEKSGALSTVPIQGSLNSPGALAIDRSGDVFLADRGNQRVLEFPHLGAQAPDPDVTLSPSTASFGAEPTGGSAPAQTLTLTNNSSSPLSLSTASFTFAGADPLDFTETNNCLPSLAVSAACQINVTFTPGGTGSRSATLQVADSDPSSPQTANLSGTGDDFELWVPNMTTDTTQSVAQGYAATYTIYVKPDDTFSGMVTLSCPAVLSAKTTTITCAIQPATVNVTPGQKQQFSVTLTTSGPNASHIFPLFPRRGRNRQTPILVLGMFAAALLCFFRLRRDAALLRLNAKPARPARFAVVILALMAGVAAAGCNHGGGVNPNETPPGSYPVPITGTAQNAGRSITLILNVT